MMANPVANDDFFSVDENGTILGDLFAANGGSVDTDPESDPFVITSVNGSAVNVGTEIILASGALLTVNADGSFDYDPNGEFDYLPPPVSGSAYTAFDSFTYEITDGDTAAVTIKLTGLDSDADLLVGTAAAQNLNGGGGLNDTLTYAASTSAVMVNLSSSGYHGGGYAQGDATRNVEHLIGSAFNDTLRGSTSSNRLEGGKGADLITGNAGADQLFGGDGDDELDGQAGADFLDGGAGDDVLVDSDGVGNQYFGRSGDDDITAGSGSDVIDGGDDNDNIRAGAGGDSVLGGDGNDTIGGDGGADDMDGGAGIDTLSYAGSASVTINLELGTAIGGHAAGDKIASFENIIGGSDDDFLTGDVGINSLDGGKGDDVLEGGGGADYLSGGDGSDTASYAGSSAGVSIYLNIRAATGGDAQGDTLISIENVTGSDFADLLYGSAVTNRLDGGGGDDEIVGCGGNNDFVGGAGIDEVFYANAIAGVIVDMEANTSGGYANSDTFDGIEDLFGSRYADELYGDAGGNKFDGWQGNDTMSGEAGDDWLIGGLGNDDLAGGIGDDVLAGGFGNDNLNGGEGDDVLVGYGGLDIFIYMDAQFGNDTVMGFQDDFDKFDLTGSGLTFADFTETAAGPGTRLTWFDGSMNHTILIIGVAPGLIDAGDFVW